jgi:hypothetical protein
VTGWKSRDLTNPSPFFMAPPRRESLFFTAHTLMSFPGTVLEFRGRKLPAAARPAGYAALIESRSLDAALPRTIFAIGERHKVIEGNGVRLLTPRHAPRPTLEGHLTFALKHEGVDLAILNQLFRIVDPNEFERMVRAKPTGCYVRRIWFFYEWLTGKQLDLPPLRKGSYTSALDPELQWPGRAVNSPRHRVRNNLPGTPDFCPLVFRTEALKRYVTLDLPRIVAEALAGVAPETRAHLGDLFAMAEVLPGAEPASSLRAASLRARLSVMKEAGRNELSSAKMRQLHATLGDQTVVSEERVESFLAATNAFLERSSGPMDPVIAAAAVAFGYARLSPAVGTDHPVARHLIQHVLAAKGYCPGGIMMPISAALLDRSGEFAELLGSGTQGSDYRYFDATPHAELLYSCAEQAVREILPATIRYTDRLDRLREAVNARFELQDRMLLLLFRRLHETAGQLPARFSSGRFARLGPAEVAEIELIFARVCSRLRGEHHLLRHVRNTREINDRRSIERPGVSVDLGQLSTAYRILWQFSTHIADSRRDSTDWIDFRP